MCCVETKILELIDQGLNFSTCRLQIDVVEAETTRKHVGGFDDRIVVCNSAIHARVE